MDVGRACRAWQPSNTCKLNSRIIRDGGTAPALPATATIHSIEKQIVQPKRNTGNQVPQTFSPSLIVLPVFALSEFGRFGEALNYRKRLNDSLQCMPACRNGVHVVGPLLISPNYVGNENVRIVLPLAIKTAICCRFSVAQENVFAASGQSGISKCSGRITYTSPR